MRDGAEFTQHTHEVIGMLLADILNNKIINTELKRCGTPRVRPETRGERGLCVSLLVQPFF